MDYFKKIEKKPNDDLAWNIPEKKQGILNVIGGNSQSFKAEIKITEYLGEKYPIETLNLILPDALKQSLPPLPNFHFLASTDSGSFANGDELKNNLNSADINLIIGDLSRNSVTKKAVASACQSSEKPTIITRDAVDLIATSDAEKILANPHIMFFASMPQLIKLFRAVYYPKILLLNQSLVQVTDALHKFTLSYPTKIITLHNEQILVAENGNVSAAPIAETNYSPISIWQGELAAKITIMNLYNPNDFIDATISALFY